MNKKIFVLLGCLICTIACSNVKESTFNTVASNDRAITYQQTVKPIISAYCISCHSGNRPASKLSLSSYDNVKSAIENNNLLGRINNSANPMPQGGLMPTAMRNAIAQWAKNGFKNDALPSDKHTPIKATKQDTLLASTIKPIDILDKGFNFFELMNGHWVGNINILGNKYDWFAFDYRPISSAHIHGIYEGGTMGNLFTSFFIANFNGTQTIMARNGGVLNGIYRTSYFILDRVEIKKGSKYFRFVDAYGGKDIMWMDLEFIGDKLHFNSYTSRFGLNGKPKLHMQFNASKKFSTAADAVAQHLNYPKNEIEVDFSNGLPMPDWGQEYPHITSASYIYQDSGENLLQLAALAKDPYTIEDIPYLSKLQVNIEQNDLIKDEKLIIYLSEQALTDSNGKILLKYGFIDKKLFDGIYAFPDIAPNQQAFTFTYLHPGKYYITIIADTNNDGYISKGDITSKSVSIRVKPESLQTIFIDDIISKN